MLRARRRRRSFTTNGVRPGSRTNSPLAGFSGGQIVIVDWRDALPKEPNKLCPAVVVEDETLFDPAYPIGMTLTFESVTPANAGVQSRGSLACCPGCPLARA